MEIHLKFYIILIILNLIEAKKNIFCYHHKAQSDTFTINDIDAKLCTHIVYDLYGIAPKTGKLAMMKPYENWNTNDESDELQKLRKLKTSNPNLKILVSVGYWDSSPKYSRLLKDPSRRRIFINSVIAYLRKNHLDGLDFSWRWPGKSSGDPNEDAENHFEIIKELKTEFEKENFILTALVNGIPYFAKLSYLIYKIGIYLDYVILHTYNMQSNGKSQTGFGSAILQSVTLQTEFAKLRNVETIVKFWIEQGVPAEKLIIGISTYGNAFDLEDHRSANMIGTSTLGTGQPYDWTVYNQFCLKLANEPWTLKWDAKYLSQYAYKGNQWVEFDSLKSVELKTRLANEYNLAGVMLNAIKFDDYQGNCEYGDSYPLLKTINSVLKDQALFPEFEYLMNVQVYKKNILHNNYTQTVYNFEQSTYLDD